ncbi:MAG: cupin domain-containing protein [Candidatus Promineifilaceae bacterium]|nr:cupin domain-containing protein [Candidatus Promineifilaceae bacterium]
MAVHVIPADEGKALMQRFVVYKLSGEETEGNFALVEHNLAPRMLAAPVHTHRDEDEYSYVLEGEIGAEIGGEVVRLPPGTLISKPRGVPHTFWNAGDTPARLLEIISPAGFERYFEELSDLLAAGMPAPQDLAALGEKYGVTFDFSSLERIVREHQVMLPGMEPPAGGQG